MCFFLQSDLKGTKKRENIVILKTPRGKAPEMDKDVEEKKKEGKQTLLIRLHIVYSKSVTISYNNSIRRNL